MGHAIAEAAVRRGYDVTLVTTAELPTHPAVKLIRVETAEEMLAAVAGVEPDIAIMAAAVADFRPRSASESKIPEQTDFLRSSSPRTPDILASVVRRDPRPFKSGSPRRPVARAGVEKRGTRMSTSWSTTTDRARVGIRDRHQPGGPDRVAPETPRSSRCLPRPKWPNDSSIRWPPTSGNRVNLAHMRSWYFTSESVTEGHPDKVADAISDSVLERGAAQRQDGAGCV